MDRELEHLGKESFLQDNDPLSKTEHTEYYEDFEHKGQQTGDQENLSMFAFI